MRRTIIDIYTTHNGHTERYMTLADYAKHGARIFSDRERVLAVVNGEVEYLLLTAGMFVRVYDTFTMQYTEFQS